MKTFFLRVRNPSVESLDEFVMMITNEPLHSSTSQEFLNQVRKSFTDFRNKFNESIQKLISDVKNTMTDKPSIDEVREIITEEVVVKRVLARQLAAVNQPVLKRNGGLEKLVEFVHESFNVSWNKKDLNAIKSLDYITKDIVIPTRSGKDIYVFINIIYLFYSCSVSRVRCLSIFFFVLSPFF